MSIPAVIAGALVDGLRAADEVVLILKNSDEVVEAEIYAVEIADDLPTAAKYCSFSPNTPVLLGDGTTTKLIGDIEPGDVVYATDMATGTSGPQQVTASWSHEDDLIDLTLGDGRVTTTSDHPFWNQTDGEWQAAGMLDFGDVVLTAEGGTATVGNQASVGRGDAYNLTVTQAHTYYVQTSEGDTALVHNSCSVSAPGKPPPRYELGWDPASKKFFLHEYNTAARVEAETGVTLTRDSSGAVEWFDDGQPKLSYDAMLGGMPASQFDNQWALGNIQGQITDHLSYANRVPIDVTSLQQGHVNTMQAWVNDNALPYNVDPADRARILWVGTPSG